jgi:Kef-type K+ transport system, predicted NAD-binding component
MILIALLLLIFVVIKSSLFIYILSFFNIRVRTAFLTSMSMGNFSEFGLITIYVGAQAGLINEEWLLILAVLMSFSFLIASPINAKARALFNRFNKTIRLLNRGKKCIDEETTSFGNARYLVLGMGSLGRPAYDYFQKIHPNQVMGIDYSHDKVNELVEKKYNVVWGDSTNFLFWNEADFSHIEIVLLAMSDFQSNYNSLLEILKLKNRTFKIGVIAHYHDEHMLYESHQVDYIYDYKANVGIDYAEQVYLSSINSKVLPA